MKKFLSNHILTALSEAEYERWGDRLEPVQLSLGQVLIDANQKLESVYFVTKGVVSIVSILQNGSTTEIGLIGKEGMTGTPQFLAKGVSQNRFTVQVKGAAMRIDVDVLQVEFDRGELLQKLLLRYNLKLFNQVSQCAACNNHHTVKQRTARWLLMLDDRSDEQTLLVTQNFLAQMLGVRRTGITEVAKDIQRRGIIDYQRGKLRILDRPALETVACECYQIIKD